MKLLTQLFTNKKPTVNRFLSRRSVKFSAVVLMITSTLSAYTYSGYAYSEDSPLKSVDLSTAISQTMNMHPEL
jgi:cobalt-zinc-cadmium efflux system outer membrane protein